MIKVLDEDIIFNELQGDPCKSNPDPCCPITGGVNPCQNEQPEVLACEKCTDLNDADGCNWQCKKIPGGWYPNFVSGCGGASYCPAPNDDFVCRDCPTVDVPCQVSPAPECKAIKGKQYKQCRGVCARPGEAGGPPDCAGGPVNAPRRSACNYTPAT